jgi:hypothetical protein
MTFCRTTVLAAALLILASGSFAGHFGSARAQSASAPAHIMVRPEAVKWGPPPAGVAIGTPSVEPGGPLRYAVMQGDPTKAGQPFTVRLACSDGYKAAPHWHPTDENIVVLSGTFALAKGDVFNPNALQDLTPGSYGFMPASARHFGQCKGETDILVYGVGPFQINWVSSPEGAVKKPSS